MDSKVSIIIPAFNVENYLRACVHSCLAQTSRQIKEIIIIDNNSTDETLKLANELMHENPSLVHVISEQKKGAAAARNAGLRLATGHWIQFLDSDDLLLPEKIEHQLKLIHSSSSEPAFVAASALRIKSNGHTLTRLVTERPALLNLLWGYGACGNTCSNLWSRSWLIKIGGFDEMQTSSQETLLMFNLLKAGGSVLWDAAVYTVVRERPEGGQISYGKKEQLTRNFFDLRRQVLLYINASHPELITSNQDIAYRIYRSFVTWLLSEPATEYHRETLSFLVDHLYMPRYMRLVRGSHARYRVEAVLSSTRKKRIYKMAFRL